MFDSPRWDGDHECASFRRRKRRHRFSCFALRSGAKAVFPVFKKSFQVLSFMAAFPLALKRPRPLLTLSPPPQPVVRKGSASGLGRTERQRVSDHDGQ
jgi:hypothetical protein